MTIPALISNIPAMAITPRKLEVLGRTVAISLSGVISPTWWMINETLKPYLNFQAFSTPHGAQVEILHFMHQMFATHGAMAKQIIVPMFMCLFVSLGILYLSGRLGEEAVRLWLRRTAAQSA